MIATLIKVTSRGPVFYTQTRVGLDRRWNRDDAHNRRRSSDIGGAPFQIYKFRTMHVHLSDPDAERQTIRNDPRVTRVGRLLPALPATGDALRELLGRIGVAA